MSRHRSIIATLIAALAPACHVDPAGEGSGVASVADSVAADEAPASDDEAPSDDTAAGDGGDGPPGTDVSTGAVDPDEGATDDGATAGGSSEDGDDPNDDGDSSEPHGEGMCGGGFGAYNDLAHVPLCPSDPETMLARYNATRGNYYHDGDHVFEPGVVAWDDTLATAAQEYAEAYAGGMAPDGMEYYTPAYVYDPYWDGTWQGYRAIAGMETPSSCTCTTPDPIFGMSESYVFYNAASAYFRANVVRIDGMSRMGIGHVAPGDGSHYWTFVFAE